MSYEAWKPIPPNENLQQLSDQELRITLTTGVKKSVWNISAIQAGLSNVPPLKVSYSTSAQQSMTNLLNWNDSDMRKFLSLLTPGHYDGSSWCYAPKGNTPHAADIYRMGFSRTQGVENQRLLPWAYVKFAVVGPNLDRIFIFSAHPEGQF